MKRLHLSAACTSINTLGLSTFTFHQAACNYPFKWHTLAINTAIFFNAPSREFVNINYKKHERLSDKDSALQQTRRDFNPSGAQVPAA